MADDIGLYRVTLTTIGHSTADNAQATAELIANLVSMALNDYTLTVERVA